MNEQLRTGHGFCEHLENAIRRDAAMDWREDLCGCVPRLIDLMESSHGRPMVESRKAVRALVSDYCMRGDLGEGHEGGGVMLEAHVKMLVRELEKCRLMLIEEGNWSDVPVPPQMFG